MGYDDFTMIYKKKTCSSCYRLLLFLIVFGLCVIVSDVDDMSYVNFPHSWYVAPTCKTERLSRSARFVLSQGKNRRRHFGWPFLLNPIHFGSIEEKKPNFFKILL